jgi:hypothetical protein
MTTTRLGALAALLLPAAAAAQILPSALPYARTQDLFAVDSSADACWRLTDLNQDGDYTDVGEITSYYSDTIGAFAWTNPACVGSAPNGVVYVGDTSTDTIYALRDGNGDGDANDPGEATIFFDPTNAGLIAIQTPNGITFDVLGRMYLAIVNTTSPPGPDRIVRLEDLNGDGDANDAGEAFDFYSVPNSTSAVGASIPTKVLIAPDLSAYYTENGTTGAYTKGVWRLVDANQDGDCNDAGEAGLFWQPPFAASPFYWGFAFDQQGWMYVTDHSTNEQVWRAKDLNGSGAIDAGEFNLVYQTGGSTWWDIAVRDDGALLLCEAQTPDRVTRLKDLNGDGDCLDAGEAVQAYDATAGGQAISLRGLAIQRAPLLLLSPPVVPIGTTTSVITQTAEAGDLCVTVLSVGLGPNIPLAPWGVVEINTLAFASIGVGFADAQGIFSAPFTVPSNPAVVGAYAFQSLSGDQFRLFLSNAAVMTVTP